MECKVTNEGVVRNLKKSAEVTFTCSKHDASCAFQFWVAGSESFYCALNNCAFTTLHEHAKNKSTVACKNLDCRCLPGKTLCGEPGSIDLTDWMIDPDEGPTGPATFTCDETETFSNHSCKFQEPHMTTLIRLISQEDYFALSCNAGECMHVTQVPGYVRPPPRNVFSPLAVGILITSGLAIALVIFFSITLLQNRRGGGVLLDNDEDDDAIGLGRDETENHQRALMAGHVACDVGFLNVGYVLTDGHASAHSQRSAVAAGDTEEESESLLGHQHDLEGQNGMQPDEVEGKVILKGIHGSVKSGQLMAIMGGSGAGKSTFLDILAHRNKPGLVQGDILVNGKKLEKREYRKIFGYVDQEDALMPTQTVQESILHSALLRLPRSMSRQAKLKRVHETMTELDILHIANERIGSSMTGSRGISGGEKRRVSIACELVTSPSILFLDEPTSGLDAYNAFNVVECLAQLASVYQRTVIFTIHQPRSDIYALFDELVLLAKKRLVYSGPAKEAIGHFASLGYDIPLGFNVADYLVDLTMTAMDMPEATDSPVTAPNQTDDDPIDEFEEGIVSLAGAVTTTQLFPITTDGLFQPNHARAPPNSAIVPQVLSPTATAALAPFDDQQGWDRRGSLGSATKNVWETGSVAASVSGGAGSGWGDSAPATPTVQDGLLVYRPEDDAGGSSQEQRQEVGVTAGPPPMLVFADPAETSSGTTRAAPGFMSAAQKMRRLRGLTNIKAAVPLQTLVTGYLKSNIFLKIREDITASTRIGEGGEARTGLRRSRSIASFMSLNTTDAIRSADSNQRATIWSQFVILNSRTFKNLYRNPALLATHYMISLVVAGICAGLFYQVKDDIGGFQNRMGLFFFVCALFGFSAISGMQVFSAERPIFIRERSNNYYSPSVYFVSKVLFEFIPLRVVPPLVFGMICYHTIGLRTDQVYYFLKFLLVLVLFNLCCSSCCLTISILFKNSSLATLLATLVMLFEMLFGGLLLNKQTIPGWASWMSHASFFNAAVEALIVNEVDGLTLYEQKYGLSIDVPGAVILGAFGFDTRAFWGDVVVLGGMTVGFLVGFVREEK
ncbi:hypothetical protein HDU98_007087 [Podochytrium sp. JEL0797]|nr:hypothetical protein HDU98_007087 [Podochytrium sp. JEL0797]